MAIAEHLVSKQPEVDTPPGDIVALTNELRLPLLRSLQEVYGSTFGWRLCGASSIAISRIIATRMAIPIGRKLPGEHLEVAIGIYDPKEHPKREDLIEEETYVRYFNGKGEVYFIDPIFDLVTNPNAKLSDGVRVERYLEAEIDTQLARKHAIHPFNPYSPDPLACGPFRFITSPKKREAYFEGVLDALNSTRATLPYFEAPNSSRIKTSWNKAVTIIQKFAPEWKDPNP